MTEVLQTPITVMHIVVCLFLMLVVLVQPGKSGGIGAALGGAGAQQVFGGRGAGSFLSKTTWVCATIFFLTSMTLAYFASSTGDTLAQAGKAEAASEPEDLTATKPSEEEKKKADEEPAPTEESEPAEQPAAEQPATEEPSVKEPAAEEPAKPEPAPSKQSAPKAQPAAQAPTPKPEPAAQTPTPKPEQPKPEPAKAPAPAKPAPAPPAESQPAPAPTTPE